MGKAICVFCGSTKVAPPTFYEMARSFGREIARKGCSIVYGGAKIGLMGQVAEGALEEKADVIGIMPKSLIDLEVAHDGLTKFHAVKTMHERKQLMYDLSDAFVALPGGLGTMDELCEILTWAQLGYHRKPCFVYNWQGFFDPLREQLHTMHRNGFLSARHLELVKIFSKQEEFFSLIDF